jgi:phosphoglucosamine mutase
MARRLFGTDGVRGVAGEFLSAELTLRLARAATARIAASAADHRPRVLVIRDTRESGEMLEAAVAAGVAAAGGLALLGGVLPTPAAPLLIRRYGFDLGVVLSASHNPFADNGVKFFGSDGDKLSDAVEEEIEALLDGLPVEPPAIGGVSQLHGTLDDYLRELQTRFGTLDLSGRRILLDCANGATYKAAPEIFRRLGAHVDVLADTPDGRNINANCGSTHLEPLSAAMRAGEHDAGFAFDGDGDRVLAVDGDGVVVDGDELVALAALHLRSQGRLRGDGVAVTVMTNYGFHAAMEEAGIEVAITSVGDRYVLEALRERDWALGGEQSGHIVELGFAPSGDGIASALLTLEALAGKPLSDRGGMEKLPQRLVNVRLPDRPSLERAAADPRMQAAIERESAGLEGRGRVLVRASGTEPLLRVMVEAPGDEEADAVCARLVEQAEAAASQPAG